MTGRQGRGFVVGLTAGALSTAAGGAVLLYALSASGVLAVTVLQVPQVRQAVDWAGDNLGLSLPVFAVLLALFVHALTELRRRVLGGAPLEEVAQSEHLVEIWTGLFFGTGVIWTAIGMRNALLYALGDPEATLQAGAFALLQRMVDGGILVALSTTIFGGVGGYLMRVAKTLTLGPALKRYYAERSREQAARMQATLERIEAQLEAFRASRGGAGHGGA